MGLRTAALALLACATASAASNGTAVTSYGAVQGIVGPGGSVQFLGVPFATRSQRWTAPLEPVPWTGVLNASAYAPACIQFEETELLPETSEDCLYLNVFVPPPPPASSAASAVGNGSLLPVVVFFSGGGFVSGGAWGYDAQSYAAATGAIVVTAQYSLGALGFLAAPAGGAPSDYVPNVGLLDQRAALRFVATQISAFGGDPSRITLSGHAAGGASVGYHLTMRDSWPYFTQALMQSAAGSTTNASLVLAASVDIGAHPAVGCGGLDIACMRTVPVAALQAAASAAFATYGDLVLSPWVDGAVVEQGYLAAVLAGDVAPVPVMVGNVMDEGDIFSVGMSRHLFGAPLTVLNQSQYETQVPAMLQWFMFVTDPAGVQAVFDDYAFCETSIGIFNTSAAIAGDGVVNCNAYWIANGAANASAAGIGSVGAAASSPPVWRYWFNVSVPQLMPVLQPLPRPTHAADIPLLFNGTLPVPLDITLTAGQHAAMAMVYAYLGNFFATGNPNTGPASGAVAVPWPAFVPVDSANTTLVLQDGGAAPTLLENDFENSACEPVWRPLIVGT